MDYQQMIRDMSPDVYARLKRAVELGKWPDGSALTAQQRENALQAVIAWDALHLQEGERVGFIDRGPKAGDSCDDTTLSTLKWLQEGESP
ncbi:MAG: hypothetical protein CME59_11330 [Halioglobus sp.]|nr:hypothetical protein [Halioglobus sp.]|tara:strand:- start:1010 stop:1279 length:270 start_codon:yes stop_codon:yes gene_type:complete